VRLVHDRDVPAPARFAYRSAPQQFGGGVMIGKTTGSIEIGADTPISQIVDDNGLISIIIGDIGDSHLTLRTHDSRATARLAIVSFSATHDADAKDLARAAALEADLGGVA
jgi:uncharacterized membrane protein